MTPERLSELNTKVHNGELSAATALSLLYLEGREEIDRLTALQVPAADAAVVEPPVDAPPAEPAVEAPVEGVEPGKPAKGKKGDASLDEFTQAVLDHPEA